MANTHLTKTLLGSAVALSLFAGTAAAATNASGWDQNNDSNLSSSEFTAGFRDLGVFDAWDTNDDGSLSQEEFNAGYEGRVDAVGTLDVDFSFDDWNTDGNDMLSSQEFHEGLYDVYDTDDNDVIEEPELGDLGDDIGDGGFWDV